MNTRHAPAATVDHGRIRTGAGIRIRPLPKLAPPAALADAGRIRTGAGIRLRPAAR